MWYTMIYLHENMLGPRNLPSNPSRKHKNRFFFSWGKLVYWQEYAKWEWCSANASLCDIRRGERINTHHSRAENLPISASSDGPTAHHEAISSLVTAFMHATNSPVGRSLCHKASPRLSYELSPTAEAAANMDRTLPGKRETKKRTAPHRTVSDSLILMERDSGASRLLSPTGPMLHNIWNLCLTSSVQRQHQQVFGTYAQRSRLALR